MTDGRNPRPPERPLVVGDKVQCQMPGHPVHTVIGLQRLSGMVEFEDHTFADPAGVTLLQPAPPQGIDPEALLQVLRRAGLDTWSAAGVRTSVLALLEPVEGVVLPLADVGPAVSALRWAAMHPTNGAPSTWGSNWLAIAKRLESGS